VIGVKIRWETHLLGMPVVDADGRRLGRVAAAYCTPAPYLVVWLVVRLPGVRRRWRAVPAEGAHRITGAATGLWVPYRREQVLASPVVDLDSLDSARRRAEVGAFYSRAQSPSVASGMMRGWAPR
jgi:hypothetical protein